MVTLLPTPNHILSQPIKLFEYMSSGLPVLGSHFELWKEIIEGGNCGRTVDPEDIQAVARTLESMLADTDPTCCLR